MIERTGLSSVLAALRKRFGEGDSQSIGDADPAAVPSAFAIATDNKLLSVVARVYRPHLSKEQLSALGDYQALTLSRNAEILHECLRITRHFCSRSVAHLFIKGPIQQFALHEDYFVRPSLDIDILVAGSDYDRSITALREIDYEVASKSLWWRAFLGEQHLSRRDRLAPTVDLHYRLQQPGSPAPRDLSGSFADSGSCAFLDHELPRLGDADIPLLSALSIVKALYHRDCAGSHVADLFVSLRAGAPQMVNSFLLRADRQGIMGSALLALRIVGETFGVAFAGAGTDSVLPGVSSADLVRMVFTPDDPAIVWPKRRVVLWELCQRRPLPFALEAARAVASEATLRIVERKRPLAQGVG